MAPFRVPLDSLRFPVPVPAGCNALLVMHLAYEMRATNNDPPPIVVAKEPGGWRIADGRHRTLAAIIAGRRDVLAVLE